MKKALVLIVIAIAIIAGAFHFLSPAPTGGSIAPSYTVAGDPNYAVAIGSKTQGQFTLGPITASTSSVTSTVSILRGLTYGLKLGDTCGVQLSSASATTGFSQDAQITTIATSSATATVTFFNGGNTALTITTGTLTLVCQHF